MSLINQVIRSRKSVYPAQYIDKPISKEIIEELLENANHAPTHRLTEPWRFKIFMGDSRKRLGDFLANKYKDINTEYVQGKYEKIQSNPLKAGAVLGIILHRDPEERVPEWEEVASVAIAVQNIWLACDQYGIGGYWSSPSLAQHLGEFVAMKENERCLGFFYLGHYEKNDKILKKGPIEEKIEWLD